MPLHNTLTMQSQSLPVADADKLRKQVPLADAQAAATRLYEQAQNGRPDEFDPGHDQVMLRPHLNDPIVSDHLRKAYEVGGNRAKLELMWDMVIVDSSPEFQENVHGLIKQNKPTFRNVIEHYYGEKEKMFDTILQRIHDASVPVSKKWVYLWCMIGVVGAKKADAIELLRSVARKDARWRGVLDLDFASSVAEDALLSLT